MLTFHNDILKSSQWLQTALEELSHKSAMSEEFILSIGESVRDRPTIFTEANQVRVKEGISYWSVIQILLTIVRAKK